MALDDKDALAYAPSGFLWDNAIARGISLHNFGEFCEPACGWADPQRAGRPSWSDYYAEYLQPTGQVRIGSRASIASLEPYRPRTTSAGRWRCPTSGAPPTSSGNWPSGSRPARCRNSS
ncbi:MAG: hypothetical protein M5U09_18095 [Gammaproteobacteria bacterium]|nr:hypothetical protein [Gammaproteobacteria bacterium]